MSEPQASQAQANQAQSGERVAYERCLCRELLDHLRAHFHVSPEVRQHLANSRVEFLKAIREVIDDRIDHLTTKASQGTKIPVE
jgi:hypothetical protein